MSDAALSSEPRFAVRHALCSASRLALSLLLVASTAAQGLAGAAELNAKLNVRASEIVTVDLQLAPDGSVIASLSLSDGPCTLLLAPHSVRTAGYRVLEQVADGSLHDVAPGPVRTLRGVVAENPGIAVAASLGDDGFEALIDQPDPLWIEPLGRHQLGAASDEFVVYRQSEVIGSGGSCGTPVGSDDAQTARPLGRSPAKRIGQRGAHVAELAVDVDVEYFNKYLTVGATEDRVNSVINTMNLQYERDVDVEHVITAIVIRTAEPDPYTADDATTLLSQFRSEWLTNQSNLDRDAAILFTGRQIDGTTIGISWLVGSICTSGAYCLAQVNCCGSLSCATDLCAHELGHLWGALHCICADSTMNLTISCANSFNEVSMGQIIPHRDSRACLNDCAGVAITQHPLAQTICSGSDVAFSVTTDLASPIFQWRKDGRDLTDGSGVVGATSAILSIAHATVGDAGSYACVVTDAETGCGSSSRSALLTVGAVPEINLQPAPQSVSAGQLAFFSVAMTEPAWLFSFQWRHNDLDLADGGSILGATSNLLVITAVQGGDAGSYECIVTRIVGGCSITSDSAILSLDSQGGCPDDGAGICIRSDIFPAVVGNCVVDLDDLAVLLSNFSPGVGGHGRDDGDISGSDGVVDLRDLGQMLSDFGTDCR